MLAMLILSILIPGCAAALQLLIFRLFLRAGELDSKRRRRAFRWGAVGALVLSAITQFMLEPMAVAIYDNPQTRQVFMGVFIAPLTEEFFKGLAPLLAWLVFHFRGRRLLLVIGAASGSGFFMIESMIALLGANGAQGWEREVAVRIVLLGFSHAFWAGMFGLGVGFASRSGSRIAAFCYLCLGYSAAVMMHGTNNLFGVAAQSGFARQATDIAVGLAGLWFCLYLVMLLVARIFTYGDAHRPLVSTNPPRALAA